MNIKIGMLTVVLSTAMSSVFAAGVGVVDIDQIVGQSTYLKAQQAALQKSTEGQRQQLEALVTSIQEIEKKIQSNPKMTAAEKSKLAEEHQKKMTSFEELQQRLQQTVQSNHQTIQNTFSIRLKQVAEQLRKENNLDVVLNKNATFAYDSKYDLTDKMIQKVNAIK